MEATLGIIKPDAVAGNRIGAILDVIEKSGLTIAAMRMLHLNKSQAEGFYQVHKERPFFGDLTRFMSEGPIVVVLLQGENAIARWRQIMGATNPAEAAEGTIRKQFGKGIERNAVHGSDSPESARFEIGYFFNHLQIAR